MIKIYSVLVFLLLFWSTNAAVVQKDSLADISFKELIDTLVRTNPSHPEYEKLLKQYLYKAKKEGKKEYLFEGYYNYISAQHTGQEMHKYTDSLFMLARDLPKLYYIKAVQGRASAYYFEKNYQKSLEFELKALNLIDKVNDPYNYYKGVYGIGQVYFYMQSYEKAYNYFKEARTYFEKQDGYDHLQGYFNSLYREAYSLYYLRQYKESIELLNKGLDRLHLLKQGDLLVKKPYFDYVLGLNLYQQQQYTESLDILKKALVTIRKNDDFANEAIVYYYIGLNYWKQNDKTNALVYFKKVDDVFKGHKYSNLEIVEAYNYIIQYYKTEKNTEQELYYTNQMLNVTLHLQEEYKFLSDVLHNKLDIKGLQNEKARLERDLNHRSNLIWYITLGSAVVVLVLVLLNYKRKREYKKKYNDLLESRKARLAPETPELPDKVYTESAEKQLNYKLEDNSWYEYALPATEKDKALTGEISNHVVKELLEQLDLFEKNKAYLGKNITLNDLAVEWNTNRSYLSQCINTYKGKSFIEYINSLRISYFLDMLDTEPKWLKYKIESVADLLGFSSSRSFSNAFVKITGMPPSYYMQELKKKE